MNDIVKHQGGLPAHFQPQVLAAQMDYARALAESNLLPKQYFKQPANLLWAISYGQTLGVDPMTAVQSIHVINGKPTASADLIAGLVRRAGHKLRITGDDRKAVAQIIRADDPGFTFEVVWTIERAQAAKLTSKDTWKQFPAAMLKARAITEVARSACSEILQGTIYTPEELGANVDADGVPVEAPVQQLRRVQPGETDQWATPAATADVPPESLTPAGRDYLHEAMAAPDAATVRQIWQDAKGEGARPGYLAQIADVGKEKAAAEQQAAEDAAADGEVVEGEVVETTEQPTADNAEADAQAAERQLRAAAAKVGLDTLDADFEQSYGLPIAQAGAQQLRAMTAILTGSAA
ncbi:MAG TPA: hypothetical protein VJP77_01035 [Planctomycetota bacterium]|nr:hypothetical protein [Planctomycetota bacterium]